MHNLYLTDQKVSSTTMVPYLDGFLNALSTTSTLKTRTEEGVIDYKKNWHYYETLSDFVHFQKSPPYSLVYVHQIEQLVTTEKLLQTDTLIEIPTLDEAIAYNVGTVLSTM